LAEQWQYHVQRGLYDNPQHLPPGRGDVLLHRFRPDHAADLPPTLTTTLMLPKTVSHVNHKLHKVIYSSP